MFPLGATKITPATETVAFSYRALGHALQVLLASRERAKALSRLQESMIWVREAMKHD